MQTKEVLELFEWIVSLIVPEFDWHSLLYYMVFLSYAFLQANSGIASYVLINPSFLLRSLHFDNYLIYLTYVYIKLLFLFYFSFVYKSVFS